MKSFHKRLIVRQEENNSKMSAKVSWIWVWIPTKEYEKELGLDKNGQDASFEDIVMDISKNLSIRREIVHLSIDGNNKLVQFCVKDEVFYKYSQSSLRVTFPVNKYF